MQLRRNKTHKPDRTTLREPIYNPDLSNFAVWIVANFEGLELLVGRSCICFSKTPEKVLEKLIVRYSSTPESFDDELTIFK